MHFYSIHIIAEYNLSGSEKICRQISLENISYIKPLEKLESVGGGVPKIKICWGWARILLFRPTPLNLILSQIPRTYVF